MKYFTVVPRQCNFLTSGNFQFETQVMQVIMHFRNEWVIIKDLLEAAILTWEKNLWLSFS